MRRLVLLCPAIALLALPVAAEASSRDLWSTVNVCDTAKSPDQMGVRARMPGDGTRRKMYMRFTAQFHKADGSWQAVGGRGASRWLYAGSALFRNEELGYTFSFDAPPAGTNYTIRGLVQFQWRNSKGRVIRHSHAYTSAGHRSRGADPAGYSAASCVIKTG
jgi:hypothetical protein